MKKYPIPNTATKAAAICKYCGKFGISIENKLNIWVKKKKNRTPNKTSYTAAVRKTPLATLL